MSRATLAALLIVLAASTALAQDKPKKPEPDPNFKSDIKEADKLDGDDLQFGVQYDGGKRLKLSIIGISFKLPEACIGGAVATIPYVVIKANDQRAVGTIAVLTGVLAMKDVSALLAGKKDLSALEAGLVMDPDGEPKVDGCRVTMRYTSEKYVALSQCNVGPSRNCALVTFIGMKEDEAKLKAYRDGVIESLQFKKPDDEATRKLWNDGLKGYCLHYFNYRQSKSGDPSTHWDSTTNIWMHLGSDETFRWIYKHEGTVEVNASTDPARKQMESWAKENNAQVDGTWRLEFSLTGAWLYLTNEKGETMALLLQTDGQKLWANGLEITREKSEVKK